MKTLERQLHEYGEFQIELRDPITPDTVTSRPLQQDGDVWWRSRPIRTFLAVAVVLFLLGLVQLLATPTQPDVADSTPLPTPTPSTADVAEPEGSAGDNGDDSVESGMVAPLVFAEIELPDNGVSPTPWTTASFDDVLYSMTQTGQLWALADGETFEFVKDVAELGGPPISSIEAGEDMLVLFARDQGVNRGGEECVAEGHQLYFHVMRTDGSWTSAQIPQPFTGESECRILELDDLVIGPHGIMITGEVDGPGSSRFESHAVGWWSPDGVDWQQLDTTIPNQHGGIQGVVATGDGFIVVTDGDDETPRVTLTTQDGQSWTTVESASRHDDGQIYEFNGEILLGDGRDFFTGEAKVPAEVFRGRQAWGPHVHFGGLGIVGTPSCSSLPLGCAVPSTDGGQIETFVYSPDGVSFVEWKPTEFDYYTPNSEDTDDDNRGLVRILGIADDFVLVVHEREEDGGTVQTLWVGRPSD